MRRLAAIALLSVSLVCGYGYQASKEPGEGHERWQLGYGITGLATLIGGVALAMGRKQDDEADGGGTE